MQHCLLCTKRRQTELIYKHVNWSLVIHERAARTQSLYRAMGLFVYGMLCVWYVYVYGMLCLWYVMCMVCYVLVAPLHVNVLICNA